MPGRVRSVSSRRRQLLTTGWEMCSTPPGAFEHPAALADANCDWLAIHQPTTVASALRALAKWSLDDPPRRFDAEDWWFRTRFEAPLCPPGERLVLGLDGIATIAEVWLDGQHILASDNMFVAHEHIVATAGTCHELVIHCRALDPLLKRKRPRPRWRAPMIENQQLRWFRTTLLGRTPGWSPPAAAVGPWRDVWLEKRRDCFAQWRLRTSINGDKGQVRLHIRPEEIWSRTLSGTLMICREGRTWSGELGQSDADGSHEATVTIESPQLWWPHTHGHPALYHASLVVSEDGAVDTIDLGHIGFRTVALSHTDGDFAVHVNGVRIFCRGACWTPLDIARLRSDRDAYVRAIDQVRAAGMNMLRVGGTMVYEDDAFLDACDAGGILLWQEFMFANMDYPEEDAAFTESVITECHQQLARLSDRPCLAVLCGNSEVEQQAAMWGAPRDRWQPRLFHTVLAEIAQSYCPEIPYWPSSAHGGSFPHQPDSGTTSYYGVGAYLRPLEDARRSEVRFATETLAFANVPDDLTIAKMTGPGGTGATLRTHHPEWKSRTPRDLGAGWDFEDVRDFYLQLLFGLDPLKLRYSDHDRYLELSRVVTGEVMLAAYAEWRSGRSKCNGALVWLLRDLWPGAGWGVVDSTGRPKAAWYYLRRALQPVAIFIHDEGLNGLMLSVVNDGPAAFEGQISLTLYRDSEVSIVTSRMPVRVAPRTVQRISAAACFESFYDTSYAFRFGQASHDLTVAGLHDTADVKISEHIHFTKGLAAPRAASSGLVGRLRHLSDDQAELTITTRSFAQSVFIDAPGYDPDDNYFHVSPGDRRTIAMHCNGNKRGAHLLLRALNARDPAPIHPEA